MVGSRPRVRIRAFVFIFLAAFACGVPLVFALVFAPLAGFVLAEQFDAEWVDRYAAAINQADEKLAAERAALLGR